MTTIFPHTNDETQVDYNLVPVGSLLVGFTSRNVTTKTYKNSVAIVGRSKRNLKDFIQYSSFSDGAILRYNKGQLTTVTPNILLKDITGVNITGESPYLAITSFGNVVNVERKEYQVSELSDVNDSAAFDKYALTWFTSGLGGSWNYAPEASTLGRFDDVDYSVVPYGVFVSFFAPINQGGFGNRYKILPLSISWDRQPSLGNPLNCNGKAIKNLSYFCQNLETSQPLSSLTVDTIQYSETNISCSNEVKVLDLQLLVSNNHCKLFTLNLLNFVGIINFKADADILLENGYLPKISNPHNTYTLIIYRDDVKLKINILHKNRNMKAFTNEN